jgi:hypothetical protein
MFFRIAKIKEPLVKTLGMKNPTRSSLSIILALLLTAPIAGARPVDFKELSLMVRAGEKEAAIKDEVSRRKLAATLTSQQESTLKTQGASDSLISSLRRSTVASKEEAAFAERSTTTPAAAGQEPFALNHGPSVHVFNVAYGQPINLSQWGGLDYEIVFYNYRSGGEDHIQPAFIDQFATRSEVSRTIPLVSESDAFTADWYPRNEVRDFRFTPYDARGDTRDRRLNFSDSVAVTSYAVGRPTPIDWHNPVFIDGQPYTFYPVYGAGGVALYYIGRASDTSATVAVVADK